MKILITGGSGLLGKYLLDTKPDEIEVYLTYHKNFFPTTPNVTWYHLDIRNRPDVLDCFEMIRPKVVIHCAAIGSVDFAENEEGYQIVSRVNVDSTKNIIEAANRYASKVIYISSNAVYSGDKPPYNEDSPKLPVNNYGIIKHLAERAVIDLADSWLIIRPFLLYGWPYPGGRGNWGSILAKDLERGIGHKLVDDHVWMPTYAADCATSIWRLMHHDITSFNVASPERVTLYQFGLYLCDVFGYDKGLLEPVNSNYFKSIAKRPADTTYDLARLNEVGIMLSDIKTGLERMLGE